MKTDYRLTAISLAVLVFAALMMLSASSPQKLIRAQAFLLVDKEGKLRGGMDIVKNNEVSFYLADATEKVRVSISIRKDGSHINLFGPGEDGSSLSESTLLLSKGERSIGVTLEGPSNQPMIAISNKATDVFWMAP